jgi:hypothetical protein
MMQVLPDAAVHPELGDLGDRRIGGHRTACLEQQCDERADAKPSHDGFLDYCGTRKVWLFGGTTARSTGRSRCGTHECGR